MKFPWNKYEEVPLERRNTLQIFITHNCNMICAGCFARNVMKQTPGHMSLGEYALAINYFLDKGGKQINLLGGEPLLHPELKDILNINRNLKLKTTIYTNGSLFDKYTKEDFEGIKLRVSIYSIQGNKGVYNIPETDIPFDANFMISKNTTLEETLECAKIAEERYNSKTFFIYSMRELENPRHEFFDDGPNCMSVLKYKELVHNFLEEYNGKMDIHISKRGVFESTKTLPDTKCRFANYFIGRKIIQCPYDVINQKFQKDYEFGTRDCQQNSTCLMSKIILKKK